MNVAMRVSLFLYVLPLLFYSVVVTGLRAEEAPPFALAYREWNLRNSIPAQAALAGYIEQTDSFYLVNTDGFGIEVHRSQLSPEDRKYLSATLAPYTDWIKHAQQMPWGRAFLFEDQMSTRPIHLFAGSAARTPAEMSLEEVKFEDDKRWENFANCLQAALSYTGQPDAWQHFAKAFDDVKEYQFTTTRAAAQLQQQGVRFITEPNHLAYAQTRNKETTHEIEFDPLVYLDAMRWFIATQEAPIVCYSEQKKETWLITGYDFIKKELYYFDDANTRVAQTLSFKEFEKCQPTIFGFYRQNSKEEVASWSPEQRRRKATELFKRANARNMRILAEQIYREGANVLYTNYNSTRYSESKNNARSYARDEGIDRIMVSLQSDYLLVIPHKDEGVMSALAILSYDRATHDFNCLQMMADTHLLKLVTVNKSSLTSDWPARDNRDNWVLEALEISFGE
jgi:hypothetical protein